MLKQNTHWKASTVPFEIGKLYKTRDGDDAEVMHVTAIGSDFAVMYRNCRTHELIKVTDEGYFISASYSHKKDLLP